MTAVLPHAAATETVRRLPQLLNGVTGFAEAVQALSKGRPASFDGAWGSACALVAAALAEHSAAPLLVVLPTEREADETTGDLEFFTGQAQQSFPSWETADSEQYWQDES